MTAQLVVHHHRPYNAELRRQDLRVAQRRRAGCRTTGTSWRKWGAKSRSPTPRRYNEALAAANLESNRPRRHRRPRADAVPRSAEHDSVARPRAARRGSRAAPWSATSAAPISPPAGRCAARAVRRLRAVPTSDEEPRAAQHRRHRQHHLTSRAGGTLDDVIAFDTGPGNCISDYLCRKYDPDGPGYDEYGQPALRGKANTDSHC